MPPIDPGADLQAAMPAWEHELEDSVLIGASRATVFQALQAVRSQEMALGRWLARLRTLRAAPSDPGPFQREMHDIGWVPLVQAPEELVAAGLVGRFWQRDFGIERLESAEDFARFNRPGFAKVVFAWRLEDVAGGTRLRAITRVHTTDARAARRFGMYFHLIRLGAHLSVRSGLHAIRRRAEAATPPPRDPGLRHPLRPLGEGAEAVAMLGALVPTWPLARRWLDDLGALPDETDRHWAGDLLLERVDEAHTRAIAIDAPAQAVWPWLMQIGLGRGGFHSYELLENLAGFGVRNVERLRPDLQTLALDDEVLLVPGVPGVWVAAMAPAEHLCFRTWRDRADIERRDLPVLGTWSLYLVAVDASHCRLLLRTCKQWRRPPSLGARLLGGLLEDPLDLVMEQRLLRTVRRLSEREGGG
ncbi:MAG: hypothetical protein OXT09_21800 [Myxococcales bacterium]|nr:hypothetical protein [Myxococcales bacterium]